jgi:3-oxoacyl-ACP reductase-like protein
MTTKSKKPTRVRNTVLAAWLDKVIEDLAAAKSDEDLRKIFSIRRNQYLAQVIKK